MIGIAEIGAIAGKITDVCVGIGAAIAPYKPMIENAVKFIMEEAPELIKNIDLNPLELGIKAVNLVTSFIAEAAKALGIENTDNAVELGLKAQYAEKMPGDFHSWQDYISYLNKNVELPEGEVEKLSDIQVAGYQLAGSALILGALNEKFDLVDGFTFDMFVVASKISVTVGEFVSIVKGIIDGDLDLDAFVKYFRNDADMNIDDKKKAQEVIVDAVKDNNPDMTFDEVYDRIYEMRKALL